MGFWDKVMDTIKSFIPDIKNQLTEKGSVYFGGKHYHFNVDEKTLNNLLKSPEINNIVLSSAMANLKPEEARLMSLSEDDLNQKIFMSTMASTAEALKMPAFRLEASGSTYDGSDAAVPFTTVAGTRSTGPPDDSGETM